MSSDVLGTIRIQHVACRRISRAIQMRRRGRWEVRGFPVPVLRLRAACQGGNENGLFLQSEFSASGLFCFHDITGRGSYVGGRDMNIMDPQRCGFIHSKMNCSWQQVLGASHLYFRQPEVRDTLFLQPLWDVVRGQHGWLRSPFFPVLFSFTVYMMFCIPFLALDLLSTKVPALRRYKIQPQRSPTAGVLLACVLHTVYNHVVFIFPVTVAHWYWRPVSLPSEAPDLLRVLRDITACLLLFDFQYFLWHVMHHRVPWLYKTFHKLHHKHTATFALSTQYSSAWETLSLGLFAGATPMLLKCHPLTEMAFFVVNIWLSVEDHSGYDFPWSSHRLVPFGLCGGPPHHDLHHLRFKSNYAPYFTHWDKLLGTFVGSDSKE